MPTEPEVERLKETFRTYRDSASTQARWDGNNRGNKLIGRERTLATGKLLGHQGLVPLGDRRVLEVGCGSGDKLAELLDLGAKPEALFGIDLLDERIGDAKAKHPGMNLSCRNAEELDFPDSYFDLVMLFTVFTSILDSRMAENVAGEVRRVLRPGGSVLWYDFRYNNRRNSNVLGISAKGVKKLFPGFEAELRSITVVPPAVRRLGALTPILYPVLSRIPPLRTHYIGLLTKTG